MKTEQGDGADTTHKQDYTVYNHKEYWGYLVRREDFVMWLARRESPSKMDKNGKECKLSFTQRTYNKPINLQQTQSDIQEMFLSYDSVNVNTDQTLNKLLSRCN